jgi:hypothetical protein
MRHGLRFWIMAACVCLAVSAMAGSAKVLKVLPHYLDLEGRHSLSPSLYERDAYQAKLRQDPLLRSALRFDIQWKASGYKDLKLVVELRGMKAKQPTTRRLESPLTKHHLFGTWSSATLGGEDYKSFGELSAWRATLWSGDQIVSEQQSFLW